MQLVLTLLACVGLLGAPSPRPAEGDLLHSLFVLADGTLTAGDQGWVVGHGPTVLGTLFPGNLALIQPVEPALALKQLASPELECLMGDADGDGLFGEVLGGGLDAVALLGAGSAGDGPLTEQLLLSTRSDWGQALHDLLFDGHGALDGTLFSLRRSPEDGMPEVRHVLSETLVLRAIGQTDPQDADVDVDAVARDLVGNLFLSFREDEWVNGTLLHNDGVLCLPESSLGLNGAGEIWTLDPGCAVIVLDKPRVDALVKAAALKTGAGKSIHSLTDLQGLELDPLGGTFVPVEAIPGLPQGAPHLLFCGEALGPTILTTRSGGAIATLDGHALGASPLSGAPLGLDPLLSSGQGHDLGGLLIVSRREPAPLVEVDDLSLQVLSGNEELAFTLAGFRPWHWTWVLAGVALPEAGDALAAVSGETGKGYAWRLAPQAAVTWPLAVDFAGRARQEFVVGAPLGIEFLAVVQAYEVGSGRLSAPAATWVH